MKTTSMGVLVGALFLGFVGSVRAENATSLIAEADAAYAKRDDIPQAKIAMITYERAIAMDSSTAVECYWKAARCDWWLGEHAEEHAEKLQYFHDGMAKAQEAIALNPDSVEAHFWLGANEGSYGDSKGILKSLSLIKPIRHEMGEVIRLNDRYLGGGAYRVLGVVDYKVPGLMGGSKARAKQELDKALAMGPSDPFTHYYLAEFYKITGDGTKAKAEVETLKTLQVPPDSQPELKMLQDKAANLL